MRQIETSKAPAAIGPYSQAVEAAGLVFVSGQLPADPETGELVEAGIAAQTARAADNVAAVLEAAGADAEHVVKTTCFLADLGDFAEFNAEYARHFPSNPARECVQAAALPKGARVEISAIAEVVRPR